MSKRLILNGSEIAYQERGGNGPPLLLLHGLTGNQSSWDCVTDYLKEYYTVFSLDHRGHGDSSHTPGDYTVESVAGDSAEFIEKVIGEPTFVWGHSMGGVVTFGLTSEHPELVRSIVLEDPPLNAGITGDESRALFQYWYDIGSSGLSIEKMVADMSEKMGVDDLDGLRSKAESLKKMDLSLIQIALEGNLWTRQVALDQIREIKCPAFLMQADPECGGLITEDLGNLSELNASNWSWKRYPGISHTMHGQEPEAITRDVIKHFQSVQ